MNNDFMQKLLVSKQIMDRHKSIPRGQNTESVSQTTDFEKPLVENFAPINAKYNLPEEFSVRTNTNSVTPQNGNPKEKIISSKLPDNIKRLMLEHPINQPSADKGPVLSDELVEKASRLMKTNDGSQTILESKKLPQKNYEGDYMKNLIKETLVEILQENGLLTESSEKTNDVFSFRVGNHIFEGKVSKIKKLK